MNHPLHICILAAGIGSRMRSEKPKALQTVGGKTFLAHLLSAIKPLAADQVHVVIGQGAEQVKAAFADREDINWVYQGERRGTGHAVQQVAPALPDKGRTIILLGDAPLLRTTTIERLYRGEAELDVLTVLMDDPFNYGRIIRQGDQVVGIVEEKDASDEQKKISEINTGVMCADTDKLKQWLTLLDDNNAQGELLLTDIVAHANAAGSGVEAVIADSPLEVTGVNTFEQLAKLERALQMKQVTELMQQGVQVMDPNRVDIRGSLNAGKGVCLDVNVIIEGDVTLGDNVTIGPNCVIRDSEIGAGTVIKPNCVIEEATVAGNCSVGPFARLRPGADLADDVGVGNFVEIKKSKLGRGSKASHLAYLGDSTIGEDVNIGAGTITCNYDGVNKHETHIGDGAFIGSNSSLVAPVEIGAGATVGAGSTITKDVESQVLAVARGKQVSLSNWQRPVKKK